MSRFITRPLRFCLEFVAGFVGILVVLGALLFWRLSSAPMSSEFLTPYVETAIVNLVPGTQVSIERSRLAWDNTDLSVTLHAEAIRLSGNANVPIAEIPALDIRMNVLALLIGRIVPSGLHVISPQVWITRDADGALLFGGMAAKGGSGGGIKATLTKVANEFTHAHFTRKLEIDHAVFSIHDEAAGNDWTLNIPQALLEHYLSGALAGEAKIEAVQNKNTVLAVMHYVYDSNKKRHDLTANFSGVNPALFTAPGSKTAVANLPLTGEVSFSFDNAFDLAGGALDVHGDAGTIDYPDFWDTPRAVKNLDVKAGYDRKTGMLSVSSAEVDFGGPKLSLSLNGAPPVTQTSPPHDLDFELSVKLANLPMNDFAKVWPKPVITGARDWIVATMSKGNFERGEATFKGSLTWNDLNNLMVTEGRGSITATNATVKYIAGMPPVVGVSAAAKFDLNQMMVMVSGGGTGDIRLLPSTIVLSDFEKHVQNIDLPVHVVGPMPAILKLIDEPPFGYAKAVGLDPDSVAGKFDGTVELKFPLLHDVLMKNVDAKANANITNLGSSKLVPGLDISDGNLALALDKEGFTLQGDAALSKVPLHVSWQQTYNEIPGKPLRKVSVTGDVGGKQWDDLGVAALAKSQGPISVSLQMMQKDKSSTSFSGTLDMKAAAMQVDELNWKKPAGEPAAITFAADQPTGKNVNVKTIEAHGPGLNIKGKATLAAEGWTPISLDFDPFIANHSDAKLHFTEAPGPAGKLSFDVQGTAFDVSGLSSGSSPEHADPRPKEYHLRLNKLITSDFGHIDNVQGSATRDPEGWSAISLHGLADGGHMLDIDLTPQPDGHRNFLATCDDFGKALKGLGLTDTVREGKLKIKGASTVDKPRVIDGKVYIGHFEVKNLPALVVLMNATSPFGIVNLFTGTLDFDKLEGDFRWHGDMLELDGIRAAGNSVGMTIDGKLDMNNGTADLNGTMAPFSMFNRIINSIPLIGDMLTGGEGQGVLGVSYTIKGSLDKPNVSVNPASLLTPGFLRNLFFGGSSDSGDDDDGKTPAPAPAIAQPLPPAKTNITR